MKNFSEIYNLLLIYKERNGDLKVPQKYVTQEGIKLGEIVHGIRSGQRDVSYDEMKQLEDIGFVWNASQALSFDEVYQLLADYVGEHGNCKVPKKYVTREGVKLGQIVSNIRLGRRKISDDERKQLNDIGFIWGISKSFDEVYQLLLDYIEEFGNCKVPTRYITQEGVRLGRIVHNIRSGSRKIRESERRQLDSIGFVWNTTK